MINNSLIYDIETLKELFLVCFRDVKTQKKKTFFVHKDYSNLKDLIDFLASCKQSDYYFIGFNNLHFDSQIIEFIWMNYISWCKNSITNENIILQIYNEAQRIVNLPDESKYLSLLPEWKLSFKQIDLYLIHHYNNKNKRTSLKYLEFTIN